MKTLKKWFRGKERGIGLVESLAAVAILGIAATSFVLALSTGAIAVREDDQIVAAQSLAHAQLEYVKNYPYQPLPASYPYVYTYDEDYNPNPVTLPEGYGISVAVGSILQAGGDPDIQKITVTISRDGDKLLTVEDYKVRR
jgi:type II secretory pathway pseudopilin PulG